MPRLNVIPPAPTTNPEAISRAARSDMAFSPQRCMDTHETASFTRAGSNLSRRPWHGTRHLSVGRAGRLPGGSTPQTQGCQGEGDGGESDGPSSVTRRFEVSKDLRRRVVDPDTEHFPRLVLVEFEAVILGLQVDPGRAEGGDDDADDWREVTERHENQQPGGPGPR